MINQFKLLGDKILNKSSEGKKQSTSFQEKETFLLHQSIVPRQKKDSEIEHPFCLNFNLQDKTFEFKLYNLELIEENRKKLLALSLGAPKDKKKFMSTNNPITFCDNLFPELGQYIESKLSSKKSKSWFKKNIDQNFIEFVEEIKEEFYDYYLKGKNNKKVWFLDYEKLVSEQKEIFLEIKEEYFKEEKPDLSEIYIRFLNRLFLNKDTKNTKYFPNISIITFNNQSILDYQNQKFKESYLNNCYYDLLERFPLEKGKNKKFCHVCGRNNITVVNESLPLPMKFYGTTNSLNFENLKSSNAYKSFGVCKECLSSVLTGMKFIQSKLNNYLFGLNLYTIPVIGSNSSFNPKIYNKITKILDVKKKSYSNELRSLEKLEKKSRRKNWIFHFMFYFHPPGSQQFDILKLIKNIEYLKLKNFLDKFEKYSAIYKLNLMQTKDGYEYSLTIHDIRNSLFPSWFTNKKLEYKHYGKDLLDFIGNLIEGKKLSQREIISRYVRIFKKRIHKNKIDSLSALKINFFITILNELNQLKQGENMEKGNAVTKILKKEYQDFFDAHQNIYQNNYFQGLFLLGTIIQKIKRAQKDKTSNILKRLNLEGISPRRLPGLVNKIKEFNEIYKKDIYEETGIWGNITDRLQGIEHTSIKPDEVVFYILSGISYQEYLTKLYFLNNKENTNQ